MVTNLAVLLSECPVNRCKSLDSVVNGFGPLLT